MNWHKVADYLDKKSDEYRDLGLNRVVFDPKAESIVIRADVFKVMANAIREGLTDA